MMSRLKVVRESDSGRNLEFQDTKTGKIMSRGQTADRIDEGKYPGYHNRKIDGLRTPTSNPDKKEKNNLG